MIRMQTTVRLDEHAAVRVVSCLDLQEFWGRDAKPQTFDWDIEESLLSLDWQVAPKVAAEITQIIDEASPAEATPAGRPFFEACRRVAQSGAQNVVVVDFDNIRTDRDFGEMPPRFHFEPTGVRYA